MNEAISTDGVWRRWLRDERVITGKAFLTIYAVLPVMMGIVLIDAIFAQGTLKTYLPQAPEQLAIWNVFFGMPHIFASLITFVERDYLQHYRADLLRAGLVGLVGALGIAFVFGPYIAALVYAVYTTYHLMMQQYGISLALLGHRADHYAQQFRWFSIVGGSLLYINAFLILEETWRGPLLLMAAVTMGFGFMQGLWFLKQIKADANGNKIGRLYFITNMAMNITVLGFAMMGYNFFVIATMRIIHDLTGFVVYAVHDHNRNRLKARNPLYMGWSPLFTCVPLAMVIAFIAVKMTGPIGVTLAFFVTYMHYYLEGVMWRRGTPHRAHAPFVP